MSLWVLLRVLTLTRLVTCGLKVFSEGFSVGGYGSCVCRCIVVELHLELSASQSKSWGLCLLAVRSFSSSPFCLYNRSCRAPVLFLVDREDGFRGNPAGKIKCIGVSAEICIV